MNIRPDFPTLYIDTTKNEKTVVGIIYARKKKFVTQKAKHLCSQKLLTMIKQLLQREKLTLKDLRAIKVETGPGSFTGTRVGVSVANALSWSLKIPVNGLRQVVPKYTGSKFD